MQLIHTFCRVEDFQDATIEFGYELQKVGNGWVAYDAETHTIMGSIIEGNCCGSIIRNDSGVIGD